MSLSVGALDCRVVSSVFSVVNMTVTLSLSESVAVVGTSASDFDLVQQRYETAALDQDVGDCRL